MLGLQLPDGTSMAIEGRVREFVPGEPGQKAALQLHLHGLTDDILDRLKDMVADAQAREVKATAASRPVSPRARSDSSADRNRVRKESHSAGQPAGSPERASAEHGQTADDMELPAAMPEDAPISEDVEKPSAPRESDIGRDGREVYARLETELRNLRECAAHDVLGVAPEAEVVEVRRAYFACTKRYHPDLFARYHSSAIVQMSQEVFIHINRAYDRMRDSLVAQGRAIVAGPALLAHDGWLAGLDDIESEPEATEPPAVPASSKSPAEPASSIEQRVEGLLSSGDFEGARSHIADALHANPRNRQLRSLYYVVSGKQALSDGDTVLAATQFEAALAHDSKCREARDALEELRNSGQNRAFPRFLR